MRVPGIGPELVPHLATNILNLTVLPTEQCNFRCVYCYESFCRGGMSPVVVTALERFLDLRAPGLDRLSIAWFGGEPLLAADVVERIRPLLDEGTARPARQRALRREVDRLSGLLGL